MMRRASKTNAASNYFEEHLREAPRDAVRVAKPLIAQVLPAVDFGNNDFLWKRDDRAEWNLQ